MIWKLMEDIRGRVNQRRRHYLLRQDQSAFLQVCSSMDVIEDCQHAIEAYGGLDDVPLPMLYLATYGVLQAMFVQQDGIKHLAEGLKVVVPPEHLDDFRTVREVRNDAIGHPTRRRVKNDLSFNFISQATLGHGTFMLMCCDGKRIKTTTVDCRHLIDLQSAAGVKALTCVLKALMDEDEKHMQKFRSTPLAPALHQIGYYLEKVFDGIYSVDKEGMGPIGLEMVRKALDVVQEKLAERQISLDTYDGIGQAYKDTEHVMKRLTDYFNHQGILQKDDALVFARDLRHQLDDLRDALRELDKQYAGGDGNLDAGPTAEDPPAPPTPEDQTFL